MDTKAKDTPTAPARDLGTGRSQLVYVAVGLSILLGGLWSLYSADGPYHPAGAEVDAQFQLSDDS